MSVLFPAIAAISGAASAGLGFNVWQRRKASTAVNGLDKLLPASFVPTHQYTDTQAQILLACDMKSATVFISAKAPANEPTLLPTKQLESVSINETGRERVSELRLDITLADERRSFYRVNFLDVPVARTSENYASARALAENWLTRLNPHTKDPNALRAALAPDPVIEDMLATTPRWQVPAVAGLAGVSALSLGVMMMAPGDQQAATTIAQAPTPAIQAAPAVAVPEIAAAKSSIRSILDPLLPRIDDISERSLMQASKIDMDRVMSALDEIDAIAAELDKAQSVANDKKERQMVADIEAELVSTQQDVLPRYRRLYSAILQKDSEVAMTAQTGGYASRNIALMHESLVEETARETLFVSLQEDFSRLRFSMVEFHTANSVSPIEIRELDPNSDAVLTFTKVVASEDDDQSLSVEEI